MDAPSATLTEASPMSTHAVDEFYNVAGKVPHPDGIISKWESGWWAALEERKQRKAQEQELAALHL